MKNELIERFTSYVKVDTQSDENNETCPSTPRVSETLATDAGGGIKIDWDAGGYDR